MSSHKLTKELANGLLEHFPDLSGKLEEFQRMPQGLFNENARLVVGGQAFVLKKMSAGRSIERHRYGATLQKVLADEDFPCPGIVPNGEGDVISAHQGQLWSLQTWANGRDCIAEWKHGPEAIAIRSSIGTAVGRLHALGQAAQQQGKLAVAPEDARLEFSAMLNRVTASGRSLFSGSFLRPSPAQRLKLSPRKSPLQKEISSMLPVLEKGWLRLQDWDPSPYKSLALTGPCHGDINWENLLFQEGQLSSVLDFDNAMEMSPAFDAVAAAAVVCGTNEQFLNPFMTAYREAGGVAVDQAAIAPLMLLKYVRSLLWQVGVVLSGGSGNDALASQWMAFLAGNIGALLRD